MSWCNHTKIRSGRTLWSKRLRKTKANFGSREGITVIETTTGTAGFDSSNKPLEDLRLNRAECQSEAGISLSFMPCYCLLIVFVITGSRANAKKTVSFLSVFFGEIVFENFPLLATCLSLGHPLATAQAAHRPHSFDRSWF